MYDHHAMFLGLVAISLPLVFQVDCPFSLCDPPQANKIYMML